MTVLAAVSGGWTIVERRRTGANLSLLEQGTFVIDGGDVSGVPDPLQPGHFDIGSLVSAAVMPGVAGALAPWIMLASSVAAAVLSLILAL